MPESWWGNAIFSLVPTIVLGLIFWMIMRMIIRGDRTARLKYDQVEAEERAKAGLPPRTIHRGQTADETTADPLAVRAADDPPGAVPDGRSRA
ncbi:hypothetical protein [Agrococcus sp. DT81.2]|uniref:hypothetical protein n=1 Tax=Agrococcus sp. DT81.2 TaxID=3393414 RepID=UPI003CE5C538